MASFLATVVGVLQERGPMEVFALASAAQKLRPMEKDDLALVHQILESVKRGEHGLQIVEYPTYHLKGSVPRTLPTGRYVRSAIKALAQSHQPLNLRQLTAHYCQKYGQTAVVPEFQMMYQILQGGGKRLISQRGALRVGLKGEAKPVRIGTHVRRSEPTRRSGRTNSIHERISEENLESLVSERLEEIEPGLTLLHRQYATPVGRIDLLCRDRKGNFVVVELKRFRASTESIIDQVTRYIGWVQEQMAKPRQGVRGYIVVGKLDRKLQYSVRAIKNLKVKCFRVSLADPD